MSNRNGEKTKVAIVHYMFSCGGAEHMVALLASALDKSTFDVRVFCIYGEAQGSEMESSVLASGGSIEYLGKDKVGVSISSLKRVWDALERYNPDVIHTHLSAYLYCIPWAVAHRVTIIHTIHNLPEMESYSKLGESVFRYFLRKGVIVPVTISETNRKATSNYYGLEESSVKMVVNPVDINHYVPDAGGEQSRDYDFINVAGMRTQKNQALLLKAFRIVKAEIAEAKLCIVGDGEEMENLLSLSKALRVDDSVFFAGRQANVFEYLSRSRVFVLSSDYEGLPLAALEAMACGLPVVATEVGGMDDIVKGNGILTPAGDSEALAQAMIKMRSDDNLYLKASVESRRVAELYDVASVAEGYSSVYAEALP